MRAAQICSPIQKPVIYELRKDYDEVQGQYIHPDLVHFVAEWISIEYAFQVDDLMIAINENTH
jgi:hypothetical protein